MSESKVLYDMEHSPYYENICIAENAILLRQDLVDAFFDNAFGVDVDVNIRQFLTYQFIQLSH